MSLWAKAELRGALRLWSSQAGPHHCAGAVFVRGFWAQDSLKAMLKDLSGRCPFFAWLCLMRDGVHHHLQN